MTSGEPTIAPEHELALARAAEIARSFLDSPPYTDEEHYLDLALAACCGDLFDPADVIDGVMLREQVDGGEIKTAQERTEARVAELENELGYARVEIDKASRELNEVWAERYTVTRERDEERARVAEMEAALSRCVYAITDMERGIDIHNGRDRNLPRQPIEGPVVRLLGEARDAACRALAPQAPKEVPRG